LTPRAICWAVETIFMVTGAAKAERLREVVKGRADFDRLPAQYIHHHSINCHWWVDEPAASLL
ncbi:MAG: 6-phosphogluconolactonase, partial [Chlorobia bacterium]|nr:6-phosphogluconolactonase [Fimbriimonadaceae bacterium]